MSYAELMRDPQKHLLMRDAFTLESAWNQAEEVWREQAKNKASVQ
jgi:hypothetical protein